MNKDEPAARDQARPATAPARLEEAFVLLDNSSGRGAPSQLFTAPKEIIVAETPEDVPAAFARLEAGRAAGLHAAGFFSFELGYVLEPKLAPLMPAERKVPLLWFGLYEAPKLLSEADVDRWLSTHTKSGSYQFSNVTRAWTKEEYVARFERVQEKIRAGDIYQLNLTFKARFRLSGSPLTFYRDLRQRQRVAYGGIVDTGEVTVLTASPELFVEMKDRTIETRPMKGTSPRGGTPEADAAVRQVLSSDVKQRAENLMIVDLMRNDIGRISEIGSVHVTDLFTVETYRTLHQMTSGVRATLLDGNYAARPVACDIPAGFGHWRAENPGSRIDRGIRDGAARRLLRCHWLVLAGRAGAVQCRNPLADYLPRRHGRNGHRLGRRVRQRGR